jgi:tripartite-type tricarboxylate transporter receptor subunit TctC
MKLSRRKLLQLTGAATLSALPRIAGAQAYPSRPVHVIVPFPPAGTSDTAARLIGQWLSERLGQSFVIENRPGAGTNIATEAVVRARPDGYTLLVIAPASAINATLYDNLNFNFIRDIAPVAGIMRVPYAMTVNPSVSAKTVPEFIAYTKANPGKINMASSGIGSGGHVCGELFKMMAGVSMVHVPYRGGAPAVIDLLAGQVQVFFGSIPETIEYAKAGKLRLLAVTTAMRSDVLPDIPALSDFLPGFEASYWAGFGAPKNTPADIVDKLNSEVDAALADPRLRARLADLGGTVLVGSPADFSRLIADETGKWAKVIRAAHIKVE